MYLCKVLKKYDCRLSMNDLFDLFYFRNSKKFIVLGNCENNSQLPRHIFAIIFVISNKTHPTENF